MLGLNSRINRILFDILFKILVRNLVELCACDCSVGAVDYSKLHCDSRSRILVVARNHNRSDTRSSAFLDCRLDLGSYGVNHTDKSAENKVFFKRLGALVGRNFGKLLKAASKDTQRSVGIFLVLFKNFRSVRFGNISDFAVLQNLSTALQYLVGCALCILNICAVL